MILIDPKKVELSNFDGIPHLLAPVVTNMKQASYVLENIVPRDGAALRVHGAAPTARRTSASSTRSWRSTGEEPLPYIVVVVDELADLMMVAPAEVEDAVIRLGQLGRGAASTSSSPRSARRSTWSPA